MEETKTSRTSTATVTMWSNTRRRWYRVTRTGIQADLSDAPTADNADKPIKVYNRNKTKYTCRGCGLVVWGKAGLDISCNECMETLDEEEKED